MRKTILSVAFGIFGLQAAFADTPVPQAELTKLIRGKSVAIGAGNTAVYGADGRYTFNGGNPGKYRVSTGRICVDFDNGQARCDSIVRDAGSLYLIDGRGFRTQYRPQ
ncbi:hypothetical protein SAMN05444161_0465 [Rhizobiales bacterium GAS191]|jgi:hypothetical protein|nr:hypothetical protein SAMN05519103_07952 [Rhizobiales bacterium GAS113]SEC08054.1 hypothetical protein SAMN05444161_0465 [Rhizobiales bacterium GAS191]